MAIRMETRFIFHCKCARCGHEWDALAKPRRCAGCKYRTWNGEDQRFKDPFSPNGSEWARKPVPLGSQIEIGEKAPRLPPLAALLEAFTEARAILAEVIEDNPCNHKAGACSCREKTTLQKIDRQIERLNPFAKGKRKVAVAAG